MSDLVQERVLEDGALVSILQSEFITAHVLYFVRKEGAGDDVSRSVWIRCRLEVDKLEDGFSTLLCGSNRDSELDGVPFIGGILEGFCSVFEVVVTGEAISDGVVPATKGVSSLLTDRLRARTEGSLALLQYPTSVG